MPAEIIPLLLIAALTLLATGAAFLVRNIIHCAILLTAAWAGIGAFYLWAGAQFVAFAQVLVYVGAVSMVVLFAVLLTRRDEVAGKKTQAEKRAFFQRATLGLIVAATVALLLGAAIVGAPLPQPAANAPEATFSVREVGALLMGPHAAALLATGILLTVALLGAIVLAAPDKEDSAG
jgi:NADH:ubiquinone oxidoreductase subunit 6 (subunit J)